MKEIVIISGKGGTGKTSITASFAYLAGKDAVVADCDVDAADLHLLLKPDFGKSDYFYSGYVAEINQDDCNQCDACADICRFDVIPLIDGEYIVDSINCEGCGYCPRVCPTDAIEMKDVRAGAWYVSTTKVRSAMVHARLGIGADNSGKLVTKVKNKAKEIANEKKANFIIVDGSPGIGCPVVASLSGADFVVLITEPTISGLHDLKRVYQLLKSFKLNAGCIINKFNLNKDVTTKIKSFLDDEEIIHIADLPYDENFTKAMIQGKTIVEYGEDELNSLINSSWEKIKNITENKKENKYEVSIHN